MDVQQLGIGLGKSVKITELTYLKSFGVCITVKVCDGSSTQRVWVCDGSSTQRVWHKEVQAGTNCTYALTKKL